METLGVEPLFRTFCPTCGSWNAHNFFPESAVRSPKGSVLFVTVVCGWSGCGAMREASVDEL